MNCNEVQREIHVYIDGEFEVEEAVKLEAHLEDCETCHQVLIFERNVLEGIRAKLSVNKAPEGLEARILQSIHVEEQSWPERLADWIGLDQPTLRLQFAGGFGVAFLVVLTWNWATFTASTSDPVSEIRPVTASVTVPSPMTGMTPGELQNAPNPVLSMVSGDLTRSAIGAHLNASQQDFVDSRERIWEITSDQFRGLEPPVRERSGRRLLGARVDSRGLVSTVVYDYDIEGSRVTAVQSLLPKGWGSQGRFYNVERHDGFTVVTFQQSEHLLTSLVSRTGSVLKDLAEESIVP